MGIKNLHPTLQNDQIHPPRDFSTANGGDTLRKNLNDNLSWDSNPFKIQGINTADINATPPTEVNGDRYIVIEVSSTVADSGWDSAAVNQIVEYDSTLDNWGKYTPTNGDMIFLTSPDDLYYYDGNAWQVLAAGGGGGGTVSIPWKFSTTITDSNPGSGNFRLNNATQGNSTQIFVSDITDGGVDVSAIIDSLVPGTDIYIQQNDDSTRFHVATVNGGVVDATTYFKIPVTISDSGTDLANNKVASFVFFGQGADFADGGEAGGANRTLGNTDNFNFGLLTNNQNRLQILNDGKVGINNETPTNLLHLLDATAGTDPQILVDNSLNGDANIRWELSSSSTGIQFDWRIDYGTGRFILEDNNVGEWIKTDPDEGALILPNPLTVQDHVIIESDLTIDLNSVLRIPANATITQVNALGEMGIQTTVIDWNGGILSFHDGTVLRRVLAITVTEATSPTTGDVFQYDGTTDEITMVPVSSLGVDTIYTANGTFTGTRVATLSSADFFTLQNSSTRTTPMLLIDQLSTGDAGMRFSAGGQSHYIALDQTDAFLKFGRGSTIGSTVGMTLDTSGNVGIGTESPSTLLHMSASNASTAPNFRLEQTSTGDVGMEFKVAAQSHYIGLDNTDDFLKIGLGAVIGTTPTMTFDTSGQVGIGTASPAADLHIEADTASLTLRDDSVYAIGTGPMINLQGNDSGATIRPFGMIVGRSVGANNGSMAFITRSAGSNIDGLVIDENQDVSIPNGNLKITGQAYEEIQSTLTPGATTQTIDWDDGNYAVVDLASASGNVTLTLSNPNAGAFYFIEVRQDSTTPRDVVWPAAVKWPGGTPPVISVGANAVDTISMAYNGTDYLATFAQDFS